jgi:hypothetical protein
MAMAANTVRGAIQRAAGAGVGVPLPIWRSAGGVISPSNQTRGLSPGFTLSTECHIRHAIEKANACWFYILVANKKSDFRSPRLRV